MPIHWTRRHTAYLAAALVALPILGVLLLYLLLQTSVAHRQLATLTAEALTSETATVEVEGLSGTLPFTIRLERLAFSDAEGVWLEIGGLYLEWSPLALLSRHVRVAEVSARRVTLSRLPPPAPEDAALQPDADPAPLWPPPALILPDIQLQRLHVAQVEIGESVLGMAAAYELQASVAGAGQRLALDLNMPRIDGHASRIDVNATADLQAWTLAMDASLQEAPMGLLAHVLGLPPTLPLRAGIAGRGTLDDWQGTLHASAAEAPLLSGDIALSLPQEGLARVGMDITAHPQPQLLPEDVDPQLRTALELLGDTLAVIADVQFAPDLQTLTIHQFSITGAPLALTAVGQLAGETVAMDLSCRAQDLAFLRLFAGEDVGGALDAAIQIRGSVQRPEATVAISLRDAKGPGLLASSLTIHTTATPLAPLDEPFAGLRTAGSANATGLVLASAPTALGPVLLLDWKVDADPQGGMEVESLVLRDGDVRLTASGPVNLAGQVDVAIALEGLILQQRLPDVPLRGAVGLTATVTGDLSRQSLRFNATSALTGLATRMEAAAPAVQLLGTDPIFHVDAAIEKDTILLETLTLQGQRLRLRAQGVATDTASPNATVDARLTLEADTIAPLSNLLGQSITGEAFLAVNATGPLQQPAVTLALEARELTSPDMALNRVSLQADLGTAGPYTTEGATPAGRLQLALSGAQGNFALATQYTLQAQQLRLESLSLEGPGATLDGALTIHLDTALATGTLAGGATDLAPLGKTLGQPLAGAVQLEATLADASGGQDVSLRLDASRLEADAIALERLTCETTMQDVLRAPQGTLDLAIAGLSAGDARVGQATVSARGTGEAITFTVSADRGLASEKSFGAELAGTATLGDAATLTLSRLQGEFDGTPIQLLSSMQATLPTGAEQTLDISGLAIQYGPAKANIDVAMRPGSLEGAIRLDALAASRLADLGVEGVTDMEGELTAAIDLAGSPASPEITVRVNATDVRQPEDELLAELPALSLALDASITSNTMQARLQVDGLGDPLLGTASLPVSFSLEPFAFTPSQGGLQGSLQGKMDLAQFSVLAAHFDARSKGILTIDMQVAGSVDAPTIDGGVRLENGFFEALASGTVLEPIEMELAASATTITLTQLSVGDRAGGTLRITGAAHLDDPSGLAYEAKASFNRFTPARHEWGTGKLSGDLAAAGTAKAGNLGGVLTIDPAAVTIPSRLPPSVASVSGMDIVHGNATALNAAAETTRERPEAKTAQSPLRLDIQLRIPDSLTIEGMGLDSRWGGQLNVKGNAAAPKITGLIAVSRGEVDALGKRFKLEKGEVGFGGDWPPDPLVAVEASTDAGDVTAILSLQGHTDDLDLTLRSNPALPREEVLSRILFGRDLQNLSALQAVQLAKATSVLLTSTGTFDLLGSNDLIPGASSSGDEDGNSTAFGRTIDRALDNIRVDVRQPVGEQSNEIAVEVDITSDIMLHGTVDDQGREGGGIQWKYDY